MGLFERLYNATKRQEEKNALPLFVCGMFCNTMGGFLDVEYVGGGSGILYDNDDLTEFLENTGISPEDIEKALKED